MAKESPDTKPILGFAGRLSGEPVKPRVGFFASTQTWEETLTELLAEKLAGMVSTVLPVAIKRELENEFLHQNSHEQESGRDASETALKKADSVSPCTGKNAR